METGNMQREINFFSMMKNAAGKWKLIVLGAVVCSILFVGYSYIQNRNQNKQIEQNRIAYEAKKNSETEEVVVSPKDGLADEDVAFVDYYYNCKELLNEQKNYVEQAPLMQLDANGFYKSTVSFYVNYEVKAEEVSHVAAIIENYKALVREEAFDKVLIETLGGAEQAGTYYSEIIDGTNKYGNTMNAPLNSGNFFVVAIYNQDEEVCKKIAQLVIDTMEQNHATIQEKYTEHRLEVVSNNCTSVMDVTLFNYQKEQWDKLNAIRTNIKALNDSASDSAKIAIAAMEQNDSQNVNQDNMNPVEPTFNPVPFSINKGALVLAFVAGAFIMFVVAVFMYLYNTKVLWEDDLEKIFGIKVVGKLRKQKNGNDDENYEFVSANMQLLAEKQGFDTVYFCGEQTEEYSKNLQEKLKACGLKLTCGEYTIDKADSLKKAAEIGNVVLVFAVNKTKYSKVKAVMEQLASYEINVLGCIVVKN